MCFKTLSSHFSGMLAWMPYSIYNLSALSVIGFQHFKALWKRLDKRMTLVNYIWIFLIFDKKYISFAKNFHCFFRYEIVRSFQKMCIFIVGAFFVFAHYFLITGFLKKYLDFCKFAFFSQFIGPKVFFSKNTKGVFNNPPPRVFWAEKTWVDIGLNKNVLPTPPS